MLTSAHSKCVSQWQIVDWMIKVLIRSVIEWVRHLWTWRFEWRPLVEKSVTGFNTFISPIHGKIIEIEDLETGKKTVFGHKQKIAIERKDFTGKYNKIEILGEEFREDDKFVSYV